VGPRAGLNRYGKFRPHWDSIPVDTKTKTTPVAKPSSLQLGTGCRGVLNFTPPSFYFPLVIYSRRFTSCVCVVITFCSKSPKLAANHTPLICSTLLLLQYCSELNMLLIRTMSNSLHPPTISNLIPYNA
jgi:hypothetical protein